MICRLVLFLIAINFVHLFLVTFGGIYGGFVLNFLWFFVVWFEHVWTDHDELRY